MRVIEFQQNWKNHSITEVVEPHITLKAQGGLTTDEKWLSEVKEVCDHFHSFQVSLGPPKFFGDDILYLRAVSSELYNLHNHMVSAISPSADLIKKYYELDDFVPHMTLGKTSYGLTKQELKEMAKSAEEELGPFPTVDVTFVRVYRERKPNQYIKLVDLPLLR
nr:2'-5' RNA ligase family protein [Halobacillus andaensis]